MLFSFNFCAKVLLFYHIHNTLRNFFHFSLRKLHGADYLASPTILQLILASGRPIRAPRFVTLIVDVDKHNSTCFFNYAAKVLLFSHMYNTLITFPPSQHIFYIHNTLINLPACWSLLSRCPHRAPCPFSISICKGTTI